MRARNLGAPGTAGSTGRPEEIHRVGILERIHPAPVVRTFWSVTWDREDSYPARTGTSARFAERRSVVTDRQEEQAALYALHTLDEHEKRILQTEMKVDARLREAITEFEETAAEMARLLPEEAPPPELRDRL